MQHLAAEPAQQRDHKRGAACAVHIVVAEHADHLALPHRVASRAGGNIHVDQHGRIGQQRTQGRIQKVAHRLEAHTARGEHPANDFRQAHALSDAETDAVLTAAPDPAPATQAATDTGTQSLMMKPRMNTNKAVRASGLLARSAFIGVHPRFQFVKFCTQVLVAKLWCAST